MTATAFNAVTYSRKLKEAGMAERVADVQAEEMSTIINTNLATKDDLVTMEYRIKTELKEFMIKGIMGLGGFITIMQALIFYVSKITQ